MMETSVADLPTVDLPLRAAGSGMLADFLAHAAVEHGPIVKSVIPAGREVGREVVFMVGPAANRMVLHTHRDHFSHDRGWTPVLGAAVGQGLLNMDDPVHAHHRRLWNRAFTSAYLDTYLPALQQIIVERTHAWYERGEIDLYEETRWLTFDIAATVLAGLDPGTSLARARELFALVFHNHGRRMSRQALQRQKAGARHELDQLLLRLIASRRRVPPAEQPRDVLSMLVHACNENGRPLADKQILAHLYILLVAGHETTTTFSTWVMHLLATLPEHRERIRAELGTLSGEQPISPAALQSLPHLDRFIREVGRLYTPVLNLPRGVVKPFEFGGYHVPAGAAVRLAIAAGHRLPQYFAEPECFDPGRFAAPREEDKRQPYALVPFGGGPRICVGITFAQIELKTLVAHTLPRYDLEPVAGQHPVHAGFWVARVPFGIRTRVRRRTEQSGVSHSTASMS